MIRSIKLDSQSFLQALKLVMKTGKRMVIANVGLALGPEEKIDYPILLSESLTAVLADLFFRP
jgi:hypothetical protein